MQSILFGRCVLRCLFRIKVNKEHIPTYNIHSTYLYAHMMRRLLFTKSPFLQENPNYSDEDHTIPSFTKALLFGSDTCIKDFAGKYTYLQLYYISKKLSRQISNLCGSGSNSTVAFFGSSDALTIIILWASWMSGQKVLPLSPDQSNHQLIDLLNGTKTKLLISSDLYENCSEKLALENNIPLIRLDHNFLNIESSARSQHATERNKIFENGLLNGFYNNSEAIIAHNNDSVLKTIARTHKELQTSIENLVQLWNVTKNDRILYVCPSYHSYNYEFILNLLFPLSVGSQVHVLEPYRIKDTWRSILGINTPIKERTNALMAEPEVYRKLILEYEKIFAVDKRMVEYIRDYCLNNIRLAMACFYRPNPIITSTWLKITGHSLRNNYSNEYKINRS